MSTSMVAFEALQSSIWVVAIVALVFWMRSNPDVPTAVQACFRSSLTRFGLRSLGRFAAAAVVFVAMLMVFNPEARLLLLFIDAIGIDLFFWLLALQMQLNLQLIVRMSLGVARRMLCN